jgi:hypothetical protein
VRYIVIVVIEQEPLRFPDDFEQAFFVLPKSLILTLTVRVDLYVL